MKTPLVMAMLFAAVAAVCGAEPKQENPGRDCATAYFEALVKGDTEKANALVAAPFSFDRKQVLRTKEEVETKHREMAARKGKRDVPAYAVEVSGKAPALDRKVFPEYEVFRIVLAGAGDEEKFMDVYVSKGTPPKVIGFSD